jgi:hypothetical protein
MAMDRFQLLLFSTDLRLIDRAVAAGLDGVVVDWEHRGKEERQAFADTQINCDTPDDLRRVRAATSATVICRINGVGNTTADEVETAIACGADELLVPMVRSPREVERVLDLTKGRCQIGILVETCDAVEHIEALAALPLARVYVGLNDLAIDRGAHGIFEAVADGTVARVRAEWPGRFGFGGLTVPDRGAPVPCRLLMGEMARLGCTFSFLRRSFLRDIGDIGVESALARIRGGLDQARRRSPPAVDHDRIDLASRVWTLADAAAR